MAGIVLTQEGGLALWKQMLQIASIGYPNVHLLGAAHTPVHTDTEAILGALELSVSGYAPIALVNPTVDWTLAPITAGAQATYATLTWTFGGSCTVYGYWLSDESDTYSLFAEEFAVTYPFGSSGGTFTFVLPPTLTSQP